MEDIESTKINPELYPKLVFLQSLSDKYFNEIMSEYGLTKRKDFFTGHEFNIQYSNDFIKCNTWTDCDNYSIQYINLYRIDHSKNFRINLWDLKESESIKKLYEESSSETIPLVNEMLKSEHENEELNNMVKEYYKKKGAKLIEENYRLHSELFRKHSEFFEKNFKIKQPKTNNNKVKVTLEINGKKDLNISNNLTFREKIKKYFGI